MLFRRMVHRPGPATPNPNGLPCDSRARTHRSAGLSSGIALAEATLRDTCNRSHRRTQPCATISEANHYPLVLQRWGGLVGLGWVEVGWGGVG